MGWDCTYHLVDPQAVRDAITLLVRGKPPLPELVSHYESGAALWTEAQRRVLEEAPDAAAQLACQLAIYVSSASLPHLDERGVAFSFGVDPEPHRMGVRLMNDVDESPERMFAALVKRRPELAGCFHRCFETNGDTGVFVPAKHVRDAIAQLERGRHDFDASERPRFDHQLRVLRAAARHGLAYWEATDLAVKQAHPELLRSLHDELETIEVAIPAHDPSGSEPCEAGIFVIDGMLSVGHRRKLIADLRELDDRMPRFDDVQPVIEEHAATRLADGRWLTRQPVMIERPSGHQVSEQRLVLHEPTAIARGPGEHVASFEIPCSLDRPPRIVAGATGAVIVPIALAGVAAGRTRHRADRHSPTSCKPMWWDGKEVAPIAALPELALADNARKQDAWRASTSGALRLGDGTLVVVWNGDAYEVEGQTVGPAWRLGAHDALWATSTLVPWGSDGFYFTAPKGVYRIRRGATRELVATLGDRVSQLASGPDDSVIVHHAASLKAKRVATVVFPDRGEELPIFPGDTAAYAAYDLEAVYAFGWVWGIEMEGRSSRKRLFRCDPARFVAGKRLKSKTT